jgi:hypothetical protein
MSGVYRSGDQVMARYERDWFHAEVVRLERDGSYLVRWIKPKSGYADRWPSRPDTRGPVSLIEPEDIRPMQKHRGNFSGF